jgi:alpha-L-fucosidase
MKSWHRNRKTELKRTCVMNENPMFARCLRCLERGLILSGMIGLCLAAAHAAVIPYAHYRMGDSTPATNGGNNLPHDSSGNGWPMINSAGGTPVITSNGGPNHDAYYTFNGSDQFFHGTAAGWNPPEDNVGVEIWVRTSKLSQVNQHVFGTGDNTAGLNLGYDANNGSGWFGSVAGVAFAGSTGAARYRAGDWIHLAVVRSAGTTTFYANGIPGGSTTAVPVDASGIHALHMAVNNGGVSRFAGDLAEARIFTFAPGAFDPATDLLVTQAVPKVVHEQTIPTTAGTEYLLRLQLNPQAGETTVPRLLLTADGNATLLSAPLLTALPAGATGVPYFFRFTADSATTTLRFTTLHGDAATAEQIAGLQVAVPQTATPATKPNARQQAQIDRRYGLFIHFGINTFNDLDWSDGTLPVSSYQPTALDVEQWVQTAHEAGMRYVLIITKHHEGFCLWDSPWTDYDVGSSSVPTDVIAAAKAACDKYGIKLALYYSLWDRREPSYSNDAEYNQYMLRQLTELLGNYGPVCELWLDGGWDKAKTRWPSTEIYDLVRRLQPDCVVSTNWTITSPEKPDPDLSQGNLLPKDQKEGHPIRYFPSDFRLGDPHLPGDPDPKIFSHDGESYYLPFESTVTLSSQDKWFYHTQDNANKSIDQLAALYAAATAQDNILVLNAPPDRSGRIRDVERNTLFELRDKLGLSAGAALPKVQQNATNKAGRSESAGVQLKVDWPDFMARNDLVWDRMPTSYYEGPFQGNGLLGTVFFLDHEAANTVRFEIGRTDVYDPRHSLGGGRFTSNYQTYDVRLPIGQLLLEPVGKITGAQFRTDLWNAETRGEITTTAGTIGLRVLVPHGDDVIVIEIKTSENEREAKFRVRPEQGNNPLGTLKGYIGDEPGQMKPNPPFVVKQVDGLEVAAQPLLAGGDYATTWKEVRHDADRRTVFLTVASAIPAGGAATKAVKSLRDSIARGTAAMEKDHRDWWHAFYPASFVTLPDARLESFYWIQWYKLASAMRAGGPVVDLMGPWFKKTSWPACWVNLNLQLAHFTVHTGNHLELGEGLCDWLERDKKYLIENGPEEIRADSAVLGNPVGLRLSATENGYPKHLIALPWLMQLYYTQYRCTMDDERLRHSIYPLLRRTMNVYLHRAKLGDDGFYHLGRGYSDEYGYAENPNLDLQMLRWGLETLVASAERLKIADPLLPKWKDILAKLMPYPVDEHGLMIGSDVPFAKPHRHYSHLLGIFPLYVINIDDQPDMREILKKSISRHTDIDGDNCMYKFTGSSSLSAALGDGDRALQMLERSLQILPPQQAPTVMPNTLYSEGMDPTFESPISAARNMLDMVLQSWGRSIRVFPACPSTWKDAAFHDLRAEGAFLISAVRKGGRTQFVRVKSLAGEPCRIQCDLPEPVRWIGPETVNLRRNHGAIELDLKKGEEAILYSGDVPPSLDIAPLPVPGETNNAWGLKK